VPETDEAKVSCVPELTSRGRYWLSVVAVRADVPVLVEKVEPPPLNDALKFASVAAPVEPTTRSATCTFTRAPPSTMPNATACLPPPSIACVTENAVVAFVGEACNIAVPVLGEG
jgi:hypothetical protein